MANQKNIQGQPGNQSSTIPTNSEGDPVYATSDHYKNAESKNVEGYSTGKPPSSDDYDDGDSKYATGFESTISGNAADKSTRPIPSSGAGEAGNRRHTGYVLDESERGVTTQRHDLVGKPPASPK